MRRDLCERTPRRPMQSTGWGALALSALLVGCSGGETPEESPTPTPSTTPASVTYYQDVAPLMAKNCVSCHQAGGIAPFVLDSLDAVKSHASSILDSVESRRMPPWGVNNTGDCNTYKDARWLKDEDLQVLRTWINGAQAEGTPVASAALPVSEGLEKVSITLTMPEPYTPRYDLNDDYRCFVVDPGLTENQFITAFDIHPGNKSVVHHVVLFDVMSEEGVAQAEAMDAAEEGPGYTCFGGPGTSAASVQAAWAPGSPPTYYPEGTGLEMVAGRKYVMQLHYNTLSGSGSDMTTLDLTLEKSVARQAYILLAGDYDMVLEGNRSETRTMIDFGFGDMGLPLDATIYAVFPHMHKMGTSMSGEVITSKGGACMADIPRWDFNWQQFYFFSNPIALRENDLMRITCNYNTLGKDALTPFGEGTQDEMCILGVYFTVGIEDEARDPLETGRPALPLSGEASRGQTLPVKPLTTISGVQDEAVRGVSTDSEGNLYVVGSTSSPSVTIGSSRFTPVGEGDAYLAKFDTTGKVVWARVIGGSSSDTLMDVTVGPDGLPVVCGYYSSSDLQLGLQVLSSQGSSDMLVAKFDEEGNALWGRTLGGTKRDRCYGVAVGNDGLIHVATEFTESMAFADQTLTSATDITNGALLTLSADGEPLSAHAVPSSDYSTLRRVGVDADGNVTTGGYFYGSVNPGDGERTSNGNADAVLFSLNAQGAVRWSHTLGDTAWDLVRTIAVSPEGDVAVGITFSGNLKVGDDAEFFTGGEDGGLVVLDRDGQVQWMAKVGGFSSQEILGVAFLPDGGVVAGGHYEGSLLTSAGEMTNAGSGQAFLSRYDEAGVLLGIQHLGSRLGDWGFLPTVTPDGQVYGAWYGRGDIEIGEESLINRGAYDVYLVGLGQ